MAGRHPASADRLGAVGEILGPDALGTTEPHAAGFRRGDALALKCSKTGDATKTLHDFIQVNEGHFGLVSGFTEDELTNAVPVPVVYRANPNGYDGEQDIARGWIWFTVTNSVLPDGSAPALRKILWTP